MEIKPTLGYLELLATQVCNLVCQGCSTYSDVPHRGYTTWSQAESELTPWLERIDIDDIGIMGGEILINPDIINWLKGIRRLLPHSRIRFVTNGLLVERNWPVIEWLHQDGNAVLKITRHVDDPRIQSAIDRIRNTWRWLPINEYGIDRWITDSGLRFQVREPVHFTQTFQGSYSTMQPWTTEPAEAFAHCHQQTCPMLYQGRIYKCSTSALTRTALERHSWPNLEKWQPYLDNNQNGSISLDSTDSDIQQFLNNFGRPHATCSQCPAKSSGADIEHKFNVVIK
jgi:hypothetical protein